MTCFGSSIIVGSETGFPVFVPVMLIARFTIPYYAPLGDISMTILPVRLAGSRGLHGVALTVVEYEMACGMSISLANIVRQVFRRNPVGSSLDRVGAGEERTWGGDACIALAGQAFSHRGRCKHPLPYTIRRTSVF